MPELPAVFFCGGYSLPCFNALATQCRNRGIPVVLLSDNIAATRLWKRIAEAIRHRVLWRWKFQYIFVPGEAARSHALALGYTPAQVFTGLYGADADIFQSGPPLVDRPKRIAFVGQFCERKKVMELVAAFLKFNQDDPSWELHLCGAGPLEGEITDHPSVSIHGFLQPQALAELLASVRCLVLPSKREHFGLVVHEAALCGCALVLSRNVGALCDLASSANVLIAEEGTAESIHSALKKLSLWSDSEWDEAGEASVRLARQFGPPKFASAAAEIVDRTRSPTR